MVCNLKNSLLILFKGFKSYEKLFEKSLTYSDEVTLQNMRNSFKNEKYEVLMNEG